VVGIDQDKYWLAGSGFGTHCSRYIYYLSGKIRKFLRGSPRKSPQGPFQSMGPESKLANHLVDHTIFGTDVDDHGMIMLCGKQARL
jgi:hypothetical protein